MSFLPIESSSEWEESMCAQFQERKIMPNLLRATSQVSEIAAAGPSEALRHFERLLTFETDCWDVHEAMKGGNPDFVLLDVRGPQSFHADHLPGATNLPHGRINERNLRTYPTD